jgi:predicted permease
MMSFSVRHFEEVISDLKYAMRSLRRSPGYTVAFVATLGLGIGANTAIFSVVNGVLLQPLPYPEADRILYLRQPATQAGVPNMNFSFVEVADYRDQAASLDEVVEFGDWTFSVVGHDEPHRATGGLVTSNYFEVLGFRPRIGRTLVPADDRRTSAPVMVLTHEYWTRVFGADSSVVGRTLKLTNKPVTVVGVLEPGSHYASSRRQDFYVNYPTNDHYMGASMQDERRHRMTDVFARMAPGATIEHARVELTGVAERLHREYPNAYPETMGITISATRWQDELTKNARSTLLLLFGTVVLVLVIACANVANLSLTRLVRRERELAIRAALGAGNGLLRRQLLSESLVLATAGAVVGILVAIAALDVLVRYTERFTLRTGEIGLDGVVLAFTLLVALSAAVGLAMLPGWRFTRNLTASLVGAGAAGRSTGSLARRRLQRMLVVGQLAVSFILLIGAGLLVRSLINLAKVDAGFDVENVLTLEAPNFTNLAPAQSHELFTTVAQRASHYPGVRGVAFASQTPFTAASPWAYQIRVQGRELEEAAANAQVEFNAVSADYFQTLSIPVLRGRGFRSSDDGNGEQVVVINAVMAEALFGDVEPVGERISWVFGAGTNWSPWRTVVGVVPSVRLNGVAADPGFSVYQPAAQAHAGPSLLVRTTGDAGPLAQHIREVFRELDPERPVDNIHTLAELRSDNIAPWRLNATLFGSFAGLALIIAAVGIGGVLGFSVSRRTNEFGIRMTFGANQGRILRMVLGEGIGLAGIGIAVGAIGAIWVARLMSGLLFEVEPVDVSTFVGVTAVLLVVAVVSALWPALRATRVDPIQAVRAE